MTFSIKFSGLTELFVYCNAGFAWSLGADNAQPTDNCLLGYYCEVGSAQGTKCPLGTFSNSYGLENVTECIQCTGGYYCEQQGMTTLIS